MLAARLVAPLALLTLLAGAAQAARPSGTVALAAAAAVATAQPAVPEPPRFPGSYTVRYTFSLPYTAKLQPDGIRYPVVFYRDEEGKAVRMDTYNSTTVLIARKGKTWELVPRIDVQTCLVMEGGDSDGLAMMTALPDVQGWQFAGEAALEGGQASHVWQYTARHAAKTVVYQLHVSPDAAATPLRLHMQGNEMTSGAHFDEWVVEYTEYVPGRPDPAVFDRPELCRGVKPMASPAGSRSAGQMRMAAVVPAVVFRGEHEAYDAFLSVHGAARQHSSLLDYTARASLFTANQKLVDTHNARNDATFTLAMNRYGDWSEAEFVQMLLPKRARRLQQQAAQTASGGGTAETEGAEQAQQGAEQGKGRKLRRHELPYEPLADPVSLPASISWRGTGADGIGPMDQATCGSCWAFSAAGAMEAAWHRATGQRVSFSEQQIVDCSWGYIPEDPASNLGCDGGNHWAAIGHVVDAGGIGLTRDYQYKGQDAYCQANSTQRVGMFKGYARLPRYDDDAHREAVYSRGPLAISLDASHPSFRFYSSGVYREERCDFRPDGLDHDVLLVGYGSGPEGDYWEVKNSWSDHWGDGGYVRIAVDNHACGVTTDTVYAVVADSV